MDEKKLSRDRQVLYKRFKKVVVMLGEKRAGGKLILLGMFTKLVAPAPSEKEAIDQISRLLDMFENAESEQS